MAESIFIYVLILALCVGLTAATPRGAFGHKISNLKFFAIVAFPILVYTLFWGLRYYVGADYGSYKYYFYIGNDAFEIGYSMFQQFLLNLGFSDISIFISTSFLAVFVLFKLSKERTKVYAVFLIYFFFTSTFVFFCQNGIRQSIATWFLMLMLYSMDDKKRILQTIVLGVVAWSFHKSALFPIAVILILRISPSIKINKYVLIGILVFFTFFGITFYELFLSRIPSLFELLDYERQGDTLSLRERKVELESGLGRLIKLLVYCIIIFYQDIHLKEKNFDYYAYYMFLIGIFVQPVISPNPMLGRMNVYFYGLVFLSIAYFATKMYENQNNNAIERLILPLVVVAYFMIYIAAILSNSNIIVPYRIIDIF